MHFVVALSVQSSEGVLRLQRKISAKKKEAARVAIPLSGSSGGQQRQSQRGHTPGHPTHCTMRRGREGGGGFLLNSIERKASDVLHRNFALCKRAHSITYLVVYELRSYEPQRPPEPTQQVQRRHASYWIASFLCANLVKSVTESDFRCKKSCMCILEACELVAQD